MKYIILVITTYVLFSSACIFAKNDKTPASEKLNTAKEDLVSCHIEFTKASIDRKCEKIKIKIKKYEEKLRYLETNVNQIDVTEIKNRRTELLNSIQKCEERIFNLNLLKSSAERVNFNGL